MRYFLALTVFLAVAASSPATAQMYPGQGVTVNPGAVGTQVLLYPGGKYVRVVPPLRQPGEATGPIRLHMPARHRLARIPHAPAIETAEAPVARVARPVAPVARVARPVAPVARVTRPAPRTEPPSDFGDAAVARQETPAPAPARSEARTKPAPAPKPVRTPPPQRVVPAEPPAQRMASIEPPPARTPRPARNPEADSGSKRGVILFAPNATDPSSSALESAKSLAGNLNAEGTARVQLLAFGGQRGDKSSATRRLSLKRALVVRQILIDNGVPSERIDVRAMGGTDDDGPTDRVDVFLKS